MEKATRIFDRLTEIEKIAIRGASPDRLDYLADTTHRYDMPLESFDERCSTMKEVQALCLLESASKAGDTGFNGVTWKF